MKVNIKAIIELDVIQEMEDFDLKGVTDLNFLMKCVFAKELGCTIDELNIKNLKINKLS